MSKRGRSIGDEDDEHLDSESTTEIMEGKDKEINLSKGDDVPEYPEQPAYKLPDKKLHYEDVYTKNSTIKSGGKNVQTEWEGKELDTSDMKNRYKYRTGAIKGNGAAPESRWQGKTGKEFPHKGEHDE